ALTQLRPAAAHTASQPALFVKTASQVVGLLAQRSWPAAVIPEQSTSVTVPPVPPAALPPEPPTPTPPLPAAVPPAPGAVPPTPVPPLPGDAPPLLGALPPAPPVCPEGE